MSASRARARIDAAGEMILLADQDRRLWNNGLIVEGLVALQRSRTLGNGGAYALQAEIASYHAIAESWERTDWRRILQCYDALLHLTESPVVALNRAVALCAVDGAQAALRALEPLETPLANYHLFYATRADFTRKLGGDPRADYERAITLATNDSERSFLRRQLAACTSNESRR